MSQSVSVGRVLSAALLAMVVVSVASGCSWFHKGVKGDYALSPDMRPLEVPPDLNLPDTSSAMALPQAAGAPAAERPAALPPRASAGGASVPAGGGFTVAGDRDEVYTKVGTALAAIDGVTITSSVQLLGSYDVTYQDSSFLIRISSVDAGAYVSALDPRGLPATDAASTQLLAALKSAVTP
ncbi:MAG: hypothetical protein LBL59_11755 [Xanthomonadaceae bacterium]|nr:hypothetical protein [Xanthomonadaceae bacterium]